MDDLSQSEKLILVRFVRGILKWVITFGDRNGAQPRFYDSNPWSSGDGAGFVSGLILFKFKKSFRGLRVIRGHISGISSVGVTSNRLKKICRIMAISILAK